MVKLPIYRISLVRERFTAYSGRAKLNCQQRATDFIIETMAFIIDTPVEELYVLSLDTKLKPIGLHHISTGTLDASLVHPRNIFQPLLLANAYAFFLLHNHPSGDPEPSVQDHEITKRISKVAELLGIQFIDHFVLGHNEAGLICQSCKY